MEFDPVQLELSLQTPIGEQCRQCAAPALSYGRHSGPPRHDARQAAVLLAICRSDHDWGLPLTRRQGHLSVHAGQVSLPGGSIDPGESSWEAAVREAFEELGMPPGSSQPLGTLSPVYLFNSNFVVTPWVAWTPGPIDLSPAEAEVAEVIWLPLHHLITATPVRTQICRGGLEFSAPAIEVATINVWGATHIMLSELREHLCRCS